MTLIVLIFTVFTVLDVLNSHPVLELYGKHPWNPPTKEESLKRNTRNGGDPELIAFRLRKFLDG